MKKRKYAYQVKCVRIGKRAEKKKLDNPVALGDFWRGSIECAEWFEADKECLVAVYLDVQSKLVSWSLVSLGTNRQVLVEPLEVFRPALIEGAGGIVIMHNHPSGDCSPSQADRSVTVKIRDVAFFLGLNFVDSVIVGDEFLFSFSSEERDSVMGGHYLKKHKLRSGFRDMKGGLVHV